METIASQKRGGEEEEEEEEETRVLQNGSDLDLLKTAMAVIKETARSPSADIVKIQRSNFDGISLPVYIRAITTIQGAQEPRSIYLLIVYDLANIHIPPHVGTRKNDTTITLKVEGKVKMTDEERADYQKKNPKDKKREYRSVYDKNIELTVGTEIRHTVFGAPYSKAATNMAFREDTFVIARGLRVTEKSNDNFGAQWHVSSLVEDPKPHTLMEMLKHLAAHNYLLDVSKNNPAHGEQNMTEGDKSLHEEIANNPSQAKPYQRKASLLSYLPIELRSHTDQLIAMPLRGHVMDAEDTPKLFANEVSVFFQCPLWQPPFTYEDDAKTVFKAVTIQSTAILTNRKTNTVQTVCVQIRFFDKQVHLLDQYGIVDMALFAELAPTLMPACQGYVTANMDVPMSNDLTDTLLSGEKPMSFGVYAFPRLLCIDLVSGILRCGFPLEFAVAKTAIAAVCQGVTNFADVASSDYARANPLNTVSSKPPVINLREATVNMEDIQQSHAFFLVTTHSIEHATDRAGSSAPSTEDVSALKGKYTVFAIRAQIVAAADILCEQHLFVENGMEQEFFDACARERKRKAVTQLTPEMLREQTIAIELAAVAATVFDD